MADECEFKDLGDGDVKCETCGEAGQRRHVERSCPNRPKDLTEEELLDILQQGGYYI